MPIMVDCMVKAARLVSTRSFSGALQESLFESGFVAQAEVFGDAEAVDVGADRVEWSAIRGSIILAWKNPLAAPVTIAKRQAMMRGTSGFESYGHTREVGA